MNRTDSLFQLRETTAILPFAFAVLASVLVTLSTAGTNAAPTMLDPNERRVDQPVPTPPAVIVVDNSKQLLADDWVIEKSEGLERTLHPVKKHPLNPLFKPEMPWEKPAVLLFGTVMYDPARVADKFRMWYLCFTPEYSADYSERYNKNGRIAYATSKDGIHWTRPNLGIHEYKGSKQNNIVIPGQPDSTCIVFDPLDPDPARRYKAQIRNDGHRAYFSPDGIHWTEHGPINIDGYDRSTVHWNPIDRLWFATTKSNCRLADGSDRRCRGYQESKDFLQWSPVSFMCVADDRAEVVYNLEPFFYETMFLGIWGRYRVEPDALLDVQLAVSRNGRHWERPSQNAWIPLTPLPKDYKHVKKPHITPQTGVDPFDPHVPWDYANNTGSSIGPVRVGDELWMYYSGRTTDHLSTPNTGAIGLGTLRLDGFFSLDAGLEGGSLTTRPLCLVNDTLRINANAADGEILVEILDESDNAIEPFIAANCRPITSDHVRHTVLWNKVNGVSKVMNKTVRLRFTMRNAKLYAFWTGDERPWSTPDTTTWIMDAAP